MLRSKITQEHQVNNLKTYYGTSLDWIEVLVPLTENEMIDIFGETCDEYERSCYLCRLWEEWQYNNQKVTVTLSRDQIVKALSEND